MWRSAESRPVFRVLQRAWRIYSTDSFEFDLINSGKWPHKLRSILSSVSSSTKQPNSLFKFFTSIQSSNLVGTRSRSEKQRVRESSLCFHFQTSSSSSTYCASVVFTIEIAWLTGKRLERVSCFVFGLGCGWVGLWVGVQLGSRWFFKFARLGLGWTWLMIWIQWGLVW